MQPKEVLTILFERGNAMQTFWGFYITVAFGLIAFFGSGARSLPLTVLLSLGFIAFAIVNCDGMYGIARQRAVLFQLLAKPLPASDASRETQTSFIPDGELLNASSPPNPRSVVAFHVFVDLVVLVGVWGFWYFTPR